jgi:hypothetical protein
VFHLVSQFQSHALAGCGLSPRSTPRSTPLGVHPDTVRDTGASTAANMLFLTPREAGRVHNPSQFNGVDDAALELLMVRHPSPPLLPASSPPLSLVFGKAAILKADPRRKQDWILKCLQGEPILSRPVTR